MADERMQAAEALSRAAKDIATVENQIGDLDKKVTAFAGMIGNDGFGNAFQNDRGRALVEIKPTHPLYVHVKSLFREHLEQQLMIMRTQYDEIEQTYFKVVSAGAYRPVETK